MKKLLLISALAAVASLSSYGQGSVNFANTRATLGIYSDTGAGIATGTRFTAELVYAPDGTTAAEFDTLATRVGGTATFGPVAGLFSGGGRTVTSLSPAGGF